MADDIPPAPAEMAGIASPGATSAPSHPNASAPVQVPRERNDGFREWLELMVFVVVLVLLPRAFLAELFVIPTGSMAVTLLGYHHKISCEQCGHPNLINASSEAEQAPGRPGDRVRNFQCENCRWINVVRPAAP